MLEDEIVRVVLLLLGGVTVGVIGLLVVVVVTSSGVVVTAGREGPTACVAEADVVVDVYTVNMAKKPGMKITHSRLVVVPEQWVQHPTRPLPRYEMSVPVPVSMSMTRAPDVQAPVPRVVSEVGRDEREHRQHDRDFDQAHVCVAC